MIFAAMLLTASMGLIGLFWVISDFVEAWPRLVRLMKGEEDV
jgi:hypothetical protein